MIVTCGAVYHGKYENGHSYTLYEVEAQKPDGTPIDLPLRSFEQLPEGEVIDVNVVKFDHAEHGTSYTLSQKGGSRSAAKIKTLEARVQQLEERLALVTESLGMENADATS